MDNESSDNEDHAFAQFGVYNVGVQHELYIRNMLVLVNKSTFDLLCNKRLATRVWTTDKSMKLKRNGGTIKTTPKSYVKRYGKL